jgi:hypothetical protein
VAATARVRTVRGQRTMTGKLNDSSAFDLTWARSRLTVTVRNHNSRCFMSWGQEHAI